MNKKITKIQILFLFLLCLSFGCQSPSLSVQAKILKINLKNEPATLDPRLARDTSSEALMRMFFEGLTRIAPNEDPQLAIAESVLISEDLKTYTFTLREAQWSNGDKVTAEDFIYSWTKILDPHFHSARASNLYVIKNGKEVKKGNLPLDALGAKALDKKTLVVELEYPTPYFLELLADPAFFPVHPATDVLYPRWFDKVELYVSNGPFLLKQWRHQNCIVAEKNPLYWDEKNVQIDGIEMIMVTEDVEMKLFEKKQLHWAGSPLSCISIDALKYLKEQGNMYVKPIAGTEFIRVNVEIPFLSHSKIRQALALAIDRLAIVEHVTQGEQLPAIGLVPPSMLYEDQVASEILAERANPEKARALFDEALLESDISRLHLPQITLTYPQSERSHLVAQAIQQQWSEVLGFQVNLATMERKIYFDRIAHQDYQLALGSWLADFNDPINFLEVFKYKAQSANNTNWENAEYVEMLDESAKCSQASIRLELLTKCQKILLEAMPILPIFHYTMLYLKDDEVEGVFLSNLGNIDFKWTSLENKK